MRKMGWMLSTWVAVALLVLCRGQNIEHEGKSLSASGYHLCIHNETSIVSFVALHKVPYTVTKPCGGWLLWKTCTVTLYKMTYQSEYKTVMKQVTRCCEGYVQVGRYCALPVNRTGEFTAKPGSCPNADGLYPRSEVCDWDIDCPGWQKCCQRSGCFVCSDPASSANYSENGGYRFNVTVTVKTDYHQLTSKERGLLNHTRLLQAMVTGALQSDMSVYYLSSWPVHPYRTATALLVACNFTLSLYNVTSRLHLLLKHIQEVSSVTVEDVDECAHPALRQCSLQAECNNTVGSYRCACRGGYVDVDPGNPGAHCTADITAWTPLPCFPPTVNMNYTPASTTTQDPPGSSTVGPFNSTDINMTTTALSNTSSVPYNSSHAPHWTSSAPYTSMSSTVESPLPTTACSPPNISSLESANITGTSFCITWSSQFRTNQTYRVVLSNRSEVNVWETGDTMMEMRGLLPGELYNVTVTPHSCGSQGHTLHILVRTDAQTLDATARITQIQFTADLQTTSSQAYKNLSASIVAEIYRSLSPEMKAMVDSGQVRIEIRGFSPGSVVVTFSIIFPPDQSQDIKNVSNALLNSLMNSSKYTVDENNTSINDFDECASGENDCSQWAKCTNIWASYTCNCMDGFKDNNSQRPGRACQAILETTTIPLPPTTSFSVSTTIFSQITLSSSDPALTTVTTTVSSTTLVSTTPPVTQTVATKGIPVVTTAPTTTSSTPTITSTAPTTAFTAPAITSIASITTFTTPITTSTAPATTSTALATTPTAPVITTTAPITASTTSLTSSTAPAILPIAPITTPTAPVITSTAPITTTTTSTTTSTAPAITSTAPITTSTAPVTSTAPITTSTAPVITTTAPITTSTTSTTTSTAPAITSIAPITTSTAPATTSTAPITTSTAPVTSTAPITTSTAPAVTSTAPTTTSTAPITTSTAPVTTSTAPTTTTSFLAPTTSFLAPTTSFLAPTASTPTKTTTTTTTTTTSTTTTTPAIPTMTFSPTTTITNPTTTAMAKTNATALRTVINAYTGAISVQCRIAAITVTVAKDFLMSSSIRESALYLGKEECGINNSNATHAQLTVAWDECDTTLVHNDTYYTASVTLINNMDPYILPNGTVEVPRIRLEVPIMCTYMRSMLMSADFGSMGYAMIKDVITGSGSFQVTVQLMNGTVPLPHNYSLSPDEALVLEVSLNTSSPQIKVVINMCWATPTPNPADTNRDIFLNHRCSLNTYTQVLMNGNSSTSRVSVQIFSIVNLNMIYLHCQVQVCVQIGSATCVPDCVQRTSRFSNTIGTAVGSTGPILRSGNESFDEELNSLQLVGLSCLGVGLSLFFIIGFVCLFYYQRNRIGHYNFSVKPKEENFTYLVFNT